jgi:hypothetical protein
MEMRQKIFTEASHASSRPAVVINHAQFPS